MINRKWKLIKLLGQPYIMEILGSLHEEPKRFVDLADACPNEKTRTDKLRRLEEVKLIETKPLKIKKRTFVHYFLTKIGKNIFEGALRLEEVLKVN